MGKEGKQPEPGWEVPDLPTWLNQEEKARKWLIPGILTDHALILMSGQKKRASKTMMAFSLGIGLAAKVKVGPWIPPEQGNVLIVEEEGQEVGTKNRIRGLCSTLGVDPKDLAGRMHIAFHQGVKLDQKKWRELLCAKILETKARLVILDAIVYMHEGDENKVSDMSKLRETMQTLRKLGCTVLFLAHLDKTRGSNPKEDIDDQVRGSGFFTDLCDQHIALRRYKESDPVVKLYLRFRDNARKEMSVRWEIEADDDVLYKAQMHVESLDETLKQTSIACLARLAPDHRYTAQRFQELWDMNRKQTNAVVDYLAQKRMITKRDNGWYIVPKGAEHDGANGKGKQNGSRLSNGPGSEIPMRILEHQERADDQA